MVPCLKVLQHRGVLQCPVPVPAVALHRLHIEVGIFLRSWVNFSAIILESFRCTSNMFILFLIYFSFENFAFHLTGASWPWRPPLPRTCTSFSKGVLEYADFPRLAPSLFVDWFDLICSACKPNQSRLRAFSRFHGGTVGPNQVFFNTPTRRDFSSDVDVRWKCWLWACLFQPWWIQRFFAWGLRRGVSGRSLRIDVWMISPTLVTIVSCAFFWL